MRFGENLAPSGDRETLEKPEDWRREVQGSGVEYWGCEASRPGVGGPQGSCACQTTMPPMFEPRLQDGEEGSPFPVWLAQKPQRELSQSACDADGRPTVVICYSNRFIGWLQPFLAHCLRSCKHTPFTTNGSRGSSQHVAGERGLREQAHRAGTMREAECGL